MAPAALRAIITDVEEIQSDARIQFQRIAQLQAQLDRALKVLQDMAEKAVRSGHARKRRART